MVTEKWCFWRGKVYIRVIQFLIWPNAEYRIRQIWPCVDYLILHFSTPKKYNNKWFLDDTAVWSCAGLLDYAIFDQLSYFASNIFVLEIFCATCWWLWWWCWLQPSNGAGASSSLEMDFDTRTTSFIFWTNKLYICLVLSDSNIVSFICWFEILRVLIALMHSKLS